MDLNVARAVFTGSLLRSEAGIPDIKREDAAIFTKSVLTTINICTRQNIKTCKDFIIRLLLPSEKRTTAFLKFLLTIAKASAPRSSKVIADRSKAPDEFEGLDRVVNGRSLQPPDTIYRRVHALYIIHDVLATLMLRHQNDARTSDSPQIEQLHHVAVILARLSVCNVGTPTFASKEAGEIAEDLLLSWEKHSMLPTHMTSDLHASLQEATNISFSTLLENLSDEEGQAALASQRAREEASKWTIPATHHLPYDPSAPWHDLPAANGLYQKRTQGFPLQASALPVGGYKLAGAGRRADDALRREVESLLSEATHCFDRFTDAKDVQDIDPLGNVIWKPGTGRKRRNHWGWSYDGIEQRRQKVGQT